MGGGVNRNYLVHLSVAPSVSEIVPVQIFLMERNLKFRNSYFTQKIAYDVVVSHDFYPRSLEGKEHNFVLSISFFNWETFEVPTLYTDFLWPEDVNDFNPRPFVQVQGHWKENMHIFCLLFTFLMKKHWKILLYIKSAYDLSWGKFKIIFKNLHDSSLGKLVMEKDWKWNFGHLWKFKAIPIEKCWSYFIFLAGGIIWELVHSTSYQPYLSLVLVNVH